MLGNIITLIVVAILFTALMNSACGSRNRIP